MTFDEYQQIDALNFSKAKAGLVSARHMEHQLKEDVRPTDAMMVGKLVHSAVFEPHRVLQEYAVWEGERRAGKEWALFQEENADRTIIRRQDYERAVYISRAVRTHPVAGPLLDPPGEAEKVLVWTDERTGVKCKGRLDWYRPELLADLKVTVDVSPHRFAATVARMAYHAQMAWYRAGLSANNLAAPVPRLIAVESEQPHDVVVYTLDDDILWRGEQLCDELLRMYAAGKFSGRWPGQGASGEVPLTLPAWAWELAPEGA